MGVAVTRNDDWMDVGAQRLVLRQNFWSDIWGRPYDIFPTVLSSSLTRCRIRIARGRTSSSILTM